VRLSDLQKERCSITVDIIGLVIRLIIVLIVTVIFILFGQPIEAGTADQPIVNLLYLKEKVWHSFACIFVC
jgi:hypothetical protein